MASSKNSFIDKPAAPVAALLLGATMWGVIWYPMRLVEAQGLSGLWLSLLIYLAALIASLPVTGARFKEVIEAPGILIPIALAAGWTNIAFVLAILDGNIMRVLLLFYLTPLWATLLGWGVLGERISKRAGIVLVIALSGAIVMLWDPGQGLPWPRSHADWLAITSGMAFAVSNLYVRKGQTVSLAAKLGVTWVGVVVIALVLIGAHGTIRPGAELPCYCRCRRCRYPGHTADDNISAIRRNPYADSPLCGDPVI